MTLSRTERDQYYEELAPVAFNLGAKWAPHTEDEAEAYLLRVRPKLYAGPQARAGPGLAAARRGPPPGRARRLLIGGGRRPSASCPDGPAASWASPCCPRSTSWSTPSR